MECLYCKGKMDEGKTTYSINRKGYHLLVENVPAFVCNQCGEPCFEEEGVDAIQHLIQDMDERTLWIQNMQLVA